MKIIDPYNFEGRSLLMLLGNDEKRIQARMFKALDNCKDETLKDFSLMKLAHSIKVVKQGKTK